MTARESGHDAVMVNCNPETVSTDYDISDRLYFEPLTVEDVLGVVDNERPEGVIVQFGGQTPLKIAAGLAEAGVPILGTSVDVHRPRRGPRPLRRLLEGLGYQAPPYAAATGRGGARAVRAGSATRCWCGPATCSAAARCRSSTRATSWRTTCARTPRDGRAIYPRPVPGGRDRGGRRRPVRRRGRLDRRDHAARRGGRRALRRLARACCRRTRSARGCSTRSGPQTTGIALGLGVVGLINVQFAVHNGATVRDRGQPARLAHRAVREQGDGVPLAKLACRIMLGERIADLGLPARADARRARASRRRCCPSTASRAPTRCSARRCARPAR